MLAGILSAEEPRMSLHYGPGCRLEHLLIGLQVTTVTVHLPARRFQLREQSSSSANEKIKGFEK
jgi:hypothetical protein